MAYNVQLQTITTVCTAPVANLDLSQVSFQAPSGEALAFYGLGANTQIFLTPAGAPGTPPSDAWALKTISSASFNQNLTDPTIGTVQIDFSPQVAAGWGACYVTVLRQSQEIGRSILPQSYTSPTAIPDASLVKANVNYALGL